MKKHVLLSLTALFITTLSHAKVWRVNNQVASVPDFTEVSTAIASASVVNGDTIYVEPSSSAYNNFNLTKQLVIIGNGYFLDGGNVNHNAGLQENPNESSFSIIYLNAGCEGSTFIGLTITAYFYFNSVTSAANITIEKCRYTSSTIFYWAGTKTYNDITVRKCFFDYSGNSDLFYSNTASLNNFTVENCIFEGYVRFGNNGASTNLVFRNNTADYFQGVGVYVANNIFLNNTTSVFSSCIVRNNLFVFAQTGITVGPLATNGNNLVSQTRASLIVDAGSYDALYMLAGASPAIGGGVDIGGSKPDCGAFGGADPYVLSGIPNIPTIYSLSFPSGNTIPSGATSINVDFSTRNNK